MTILAAPAPGTIMPGVLGFLVVAGMGLALFFLLRSMNKQLHKVAARSRSENEGPFRRPGRPGGGERPGDGERPGSGERPGASARP